MSDRLFANFIIASQRGLQVSDTEMAKLLAVSRSTIARWKANKSQPHRLAQLAVVECLTNHMEAKDKVMRGQS